MKNTFVIIGGVAGGASCATRLRRLDESAEIIVLERGGYVSFANCGLPYYIGGDIAEEGALLAHTPESLRAAFNLDVRVLNEAVAIHPEEKTVDVRRLDTGEQYTLAYDKLLLSPGAQPLRPNLPGIDEPGVFTLRGMEDVQAIHDRVQTAKSAIVVGGGFIGVELAENLAQRGLAVRLIEAAEQILPPFDPEMAHMLARHLREKGVDIHTGCALLGIHRREKGLAALHAHGECTADIVLLAIGVRPEDALARKAGLAVVERGGILVDERLQTSDPHIFAVGDAILTENSITGKLGPLPLAGPANRQGRMAADNMLGGREVFGGVVGSAIVKVCACTGACVGVNEKLLKADGKGYQRLYILARDHADYYPGATRMWLKLLYSPNDRRVLGAQGVGEKGVDKRIDVIAAAMRMGATVDDLAQLELAYAPPYSSAKDPVNLLGMSAQDNLAGLTRDVHWDEVDKLDKERTLFLDVREASEHEAGALPGSLLIPLGELRGRLEEIPRDKAIVVYCHSGARAYNAERILRQNGFDDVRNLSGGFALYEALEGIR